MATNGKLTLNHLTNIVDNLLLQRTQLLEKMLDPRRDIDEECGYPQQLTIRQYAYLYDREGIGARVVDVYPDECWDQDPWVFETEEGDETSFEEGWRLLEERMNIYHYLHRVDRMSGVGQFGLLLLGIDDGLNLEQPVANLDETGKQTSQVERQLLYLRPFAETQVEVAQYEVNLNNPRYGQPVFYNVNMGEFDMAGLPVTARNVKVHWSRVIHVADNRTSSEVFGVPRQQQAYNRIYDLRKILSGSGEMFWKGAFPGYSFEVNPDLADVEIDKEAMREEFARFSNSLQRYLALTGVSAKSLAPQVASPLDHMKAQLQAIAITIGCPLRILMGSEEAQLAGEQDNAHWNKRLKRRQNRYLTPQLIRPLIDRLIAVGALPPPQEQTKDERYVYTVEWPDLSSPSDKDKADVAKVMTETMAKYIQGGVDTLIPPLEFLTSILGMDVEEAQGILESALDRIASEETDALQTKQAEETAVEAQRRQEEMDMQRQAQQAKVQA